MNSPSKYSHQRESIISFLKERKDHPTADVVYQHMREIIPNISLGTVYRNLNQLASSGTILRLHCDGKTDHFDACTSPHYHFLCRKCGCVKDVNMPVLTNLIDDANSDSNFEIDDVSILFSGTCNDCLHI